MSLLPAILALQIIFFPLSSILLETSTPGAQDIKGPMLHPMITVAFSFLLDASQHQHLNPNATG
jgi:hypothetical protein